MVKISTAIVTGIIISFSHVSLANQTCQEITDTNYNLVKDGYAEKCGSYHACLKDTEEDLGWYSPFVKSTISLSEGGSVSVGSCKLSCDEGLVAVQSCQTVSDLNYKLLMSGKVKFCDGYELCTPGGEKVGAYEPWSKSVLSVVGGTDIKVGACEVEREQAECIHQSSYVVLQELKLELPQGTWDIELLKMPIPDGGYTYAQWVKPNIEGPQPVVVHTMPYDLIDWTGETIDEEAAAQFPDNVTKPLVVAANLIESLNKGYGVMLTYGRFYTGESLENDIQDTVASLEFLAQSEDVDKDKVAIYGISWGGMQSLHASARAPENLKVIAAVAYAPPSDLGDLDFYANQTIPQIIEDPALLQQYQMFYSQYNQRIQLSTGAHVWEDEQSFYPYSNEYLVDAIPAHTEVLILHDTWDTIVPIDGTLKLAALAIGSKDIVPMIYPHKEEFEINSLGLGHGAGLVYMLYTPFSPLFMYSKLHGDNPEPMELKYYPEYLMMYISKIKEVVDATPGGIRKADFLKPRLEELGDRRVVMISTDSEGKEQRVRGSVLKQQIIDMIWGGDCQYNDGDCCSSSDMAPAEVINPCKG